MKILKTLTRIYVKPEKLEEIIQFYEKLFNQKPTLRFKYDEKNLELVQIDSILLICGKAKDLEPFLDTKVTFLVNSIQKAMDFLQKEKATIIQHPKNVPTGKNMRVMHIDGLIAEYVELNHN